MAAPGRPDGPDGPRRHGGRGGRHAAGFGSGSSKAARIPPARPPSCESAKAVGGAWARVQRMRSESAACGARRGRKSPTWLCLKVEAELAKLAELAELARETDHHPFSEQPAPRRHAVIAAQPAQTTKRGTSVTGGRRCALQLLHDTHYGASLFREGSGSAPITSRAAWPAWPAWICLDRADRCGVGYASRSARAGEAAPAGTSGREQVVQARYVSASRCCLLLAAAAARCSSLQGACRFGEYETSIRLDSRPYGLVPVLSCCALRAAC